MIKENDLLRRFMNTLDLETEEDFELHERLEKFIRDPEYYEQWAKIEKVGEGDPWEIVDREVNFDVEEK